EKAGDDGRADAPVAGRIVSRRKRPALRVMGGKSAS
ncbi:LysR family transcriptional regulator, partial [Mesorhizobium sp. M7A.F.Ca.CA.004.02.1.1]